MIVKNTYAYIITYENLAILKNSVARSRSITRMEKKINTNLNTNPCL